MTMPSSFLFRATLAGLLCSSALAQAADLPPALQSLQEQGLSIVGQFDAPGGLKAWGAYNGNHPLAIYALPDGQHMLVGTLIDAKGEEVRPAGLDTLVQPAIAKDMLDKLEKSRWIADGKDDAPRVVYIFTDPNCPYCMQLWQMARPWVDAGKVQLRHIPVGILTPTSGPKSAAILAAQDPTAALHDHSVAMLKDRSGGIKGLSAIPPDIDAQLTANEDLMVGWDLRATPALVWQDEQGRIQMQTGASPDVAQRAFGPR
ncbi:thiol:disulfide interchange protein DsbG [Alcaligenes sp. SDU_A2]|uniref:thiol:disulfide interchange protein DsbG n=1 Tax=Alcaligenes sp. SDU_A2 TaxID=3136634 RepID=UPI00311E17DD